MLGKKGIVLAALFFLIAISVNFASGESANIWTTDAYGNPKTDFSPGDFVYIHGSGFLPNANIKVSVLNPLGMTYISYATSNLLGEFIFVYDIYLMEGEYRATASDSENYAEIIFTDAATYVIVITSPTNGGTSTSPVRVYGSWDITNNPPGQLSQYNVQINWGDGTAPQNVNIVRNEAPSGPKHYWGTFDSNPGFNHIYSSTQSCQQYTITVKLYHQTAPGQESYDSITTSTIRLQEVCNDGLDNDCDTFTDCADSDCTGTPSCPSCTPATEICDGIDNDCDGSIDEGFNVGAACDGADSDLCKEGTYSCSAGAAVCSDVTGNTLELCNGLDDDCDGSIDEDFTNKGQSCSAGIGACQNSGVYVCSQSGSGTECNAVAGQPSSEVCTGGIDEDCDGNTDCLDSECATNIACGGCTTNDDCSSLDTDCASGVCGTDHKCAQVFKSAATVCRISAGACDVAETCTGSSANCPADSVRANGYVCASESAQCDADDTCNGVTKVCNENYASSGTSCNDGLFCNSGETCNGAGVCNGGTAVSCSANNIAGVATCVNTPDENPATWDYRIAFTSTCNENTYACTTGSSSISHSCSVDSCVAECDATHGCADTSCGTDGCVGLDYYDYSDVSNSCSEGCLCSHNQCSAPAISKNDARCTCQLDSDRDGVNNCIDDCPDSMPNEPVDINGCDIFQFCRQFSCGNSCYYADWNYDEPLTKFPHDCTTVIISNEGTYEARCVPTVNTPECSGTLSKN